MKICSICGENKEDNQFYKRYEGSTLEKFCKKCRIKRYYTPSIKPRFLLDKAENAKKKKKFIVYCAVGIKNADIARWMDMSEATVCNYRKKYASEISDMIGSMINANIGDDSGEVNELTVV